MEHGSAPVPDRAPVGLGSPSHRHIAWVGALAGRGVFAVAAASVEMVARLFELAVLPMSQAEFGWGGTLAAQADERGRCAGSA